jgi:hypothetical protein
MKRLEKLGASVDDKAPSFADAENCFQVLRAINFAASTWPRHQLQAHRQAGFGEAHGQRDRRRAGKRDGKGEHQPADIGIEFAAVHFFQITRAVIEGRRHHGGQSQEIMALEETGQPVIEQSLLALSALLEAELNLGTQNLVEPR